MAAKSGVHELKEVIGRMAFDSISAGSYRSRPIIKDGENAP